MLGYSEMLLEESEASGNEHFVQDLKKIRAAGWKLLALMDAWPPAVFSLLKKPASGSSLTWTLSVVELPADCSGNDWWQYRAAIQSSANGYSHIDATLWDKHGRACVLSRQTVSVFA